MLTKILPVALHIPSPNRILRMEEYMLRKSEESRRGCQESVQHCSQHSVPCQLYSTMIVVLYVVVKGEYLESTTMKLVEKFVIASYHCPFDVLRVVYPGHVLWIAFVV